MTAFQSCQGVWHYLWVFRVVTLQGDEQTLQKIAQQDVPITRNTAYEDLDNMVKYSFRLGNMVK